MFPTAHHDDVGMPCPGSDDDEDETTVLVAGAEPPQPDYNMDEEDNDSLPASPPGGALLSETTEPANSSSDKIMAPRAYQLELFQASMQQNIIVSMDTGSGKTQVAVLRIQAELERTDTDKRVWFLAPTVSLCAQQFEVLRSQIPTVGVKMLSGDDNVDSWSNQAIWDAALSGVRVVVCPYQILSEALKHSFVTLEHISLIVLDEAHNCSRNHPGRRIMTEFYQPRKNARQTVPHILGLTASPVVRFDIGSMEALEASLDAVCRGPTGHRDELLVNTNRPVMLVTFYPKTLVSRSHWTSNMERLYKALQELEDKIGEDPYVLYLASQNTARSERKLEEVLETRDTFIQKQTQAFMVRTKNLLCDLGSWAVDKYMCQAIKRAANMRTQELCLAGWRDDERNYLATFLKQIRAKEPQSSHPTTATSAMKLQALVAVLRDFEGDPVGIVFVKERATAALLADVLSSLPDLNKRYEVGCMVGTSRFAGRKRDFYDLSPTVDERGASALDKFRRGRINLLVATSVLEEGIDVPACNLVVCFDKPASLRSLIQRRGRARKRSSQLHLLLEDGQKSAAAEWNALESEMKRRYEDEMRNLDHLRRLEEEEAESTVLEGPLAPLRAKDTAARLTLDDAKSHLDHFCRIIGSRKFVDPSPEYIITETPAGRSLATVLLPVSLPPNLREAKSSQDWLSQKNACKDAAFQAYKMLYENGLLNQSLLPIKNDVTVDSRHVEGRPGMTMVRQQFSPWAEIAQGWETETRLNVYRRRLRLTDHDESVICEVDALLPVPFPSIPPFKLYYTQYSSQPWTVSLGQTVPEVGADFDAALALDHTRTLLGMSFGRRFSIEDQSRSLRLVWPNATLQPGRIDCMLFSQERHASGGERLVRDESNSTYIYQSWLPYKPSLDLVREHYKGLDEAPHDQPYLVVRKWPKLCGFLARNPGFGSARQDEQPVEEVQTTGRKPYPQIIPAENCRVDDDDLSVTMGQLGMLIPSITHVVETYLVAEELLRSTRLRELKLKNIGLVVTALSAPSAQNQTNYERLEFLGDTTLKLATFITCAANNLEYPEGYLSLFKDRIVSNSRLSRAAVAFGLDRFIMVKGNTLRDWRKMLQIPEPTSRRNMSTKTLADVVEALIGAAHMEGGMDLALGCIRLFLPDEDWRSLAKSQQILYQAAPESLELPSTMTALEKMLDYPFQNKALLVQAMTHSSYNLPGSPIGCMERHEFVGDSVLDSVVVSQLFAFGAGEDSGPTLAHQEMHLLRTALVNADFLAFLTMEWRAPPTPRFKVNVTKSGGDEDGYASDTPAPEYEETEPEPGTPLWAFMRHMSGELTLVLGQTARRHAALAGEIRRAMAEDRRYPWDLLARLRAPKVYSDLFEAVMGAVWIDSGSVDACVAVAERAGILPYLRRCVADGVKILHPKEELGRLAVSEKVVYAVKEAPRERQEDDLQSDAAAGAMFECTVTVGKRVVASVSDGVTREEVRTRAAGFAVRLWEEAGGTWEGVGVPVGV